MLVSPFLSLAVRRERSAHEAAYIEVDLIALCDLPHLATQVSGRKASILPNSRVHVRQDRLDAQALQPPLARTPDVTSKHCLDAHIPLRRQSFQGHLYHAQASAICGNTDRALW